ncbi:MAG: RNA polymerase factor sigma-54 [Treponema sp.]|nr:RNA polymerase factor sigma-54 [Treponema sp.]
MLRPSMTQTQKLQINPQMYQSLKLMELPVLDLREKIAEELERNPALEALQDKSTVSLDAPAQKEEYEYFEASSDPGFTRGGGEEAAEEQRRFIEGALSQAETLQEHLLWQLRLGPADGELRRLGELLIQNLDDDGFHREPVEVLLKGENPQNVQEALSLVQRLDPAGTCTADYRESLRVQALLLPDAPKGIVKALSQLELLERGKTAEAAKLMGMGEKEAAAVFERIKELAPFPGRRFSSGEVRYVIPDIQVVKKEGDFIIILNEEEIPVLGLNPFFLELAEGSAPVGAGGKEDKPVRDFARENIKEARWFMNAINHRNHTLLRVCRALIEFQRPFFMNGPKRLAPLTLGDIAGELGIHAATVSRTANGKYVQTEWGIFELRHFFTNSITGAGSGGSGYSKEGVKEILREIIAGEQERLSDQDIVRILANRGIALARRTVAKYRKELDVKSSFDR